MNSKKLIIFLTSGLLVVIFLFWVFKSPFQSAKKQTFSRKPFTTPSKGKKVPPPSNKIETGRLRSSYSSWGRNPFIPGQSGDISGLILSGILWDDENPLAIINGKIIKQGDKIEGKRIIEIKKDRIIVNDGQGNLELKLKWED